ATGVIDRAVGKVNLNRGTCYFTTKIGRDNVDFAVNLIAVKIGETRNSAITERHGVVNATLIGTEVVLSRGFQRNLAPHSPVTGRDIGKGGLASWEGNGGELRAAIGGKIEHHVLNANRAVAAERI